MIINPVNIFSNVQSPEAAHKRPCLYAGNLAPLEKDTVSFSGAAKLLGEHMSSAPSRQMCIKVHNRLKPAEYRLEAVLKKYIEPINEKYAKDCRYPADRPAVTINTRTKDPDSIREKAVSKFSKTAGDEKYDFCEAAVPKIFEYFEPIEAGYTEKTALSDAKNYMDILSEYKECLAAGNEEKLTDEIINMLARRRKISYNPKNRKDKSAFNQIVKYMKTVTANSNTPAVKPSSIEGIKYYVNDIAGARIILNYPDAAIAQKVILALKKAVQDGALNIKSVENYLPDKKKLPAGKLLSDYEYLAPRKIKVLTDAANAGYEENVSKSGYIAIHVNLDLTSDKLPAECAGFQGEIQIMGADIEKLKDVEDLCYKLKDDKSSIKAKYKPFKEHFRKYYQGADVQKAFNDYTYALYLKQRELPAGTAADTPFPSIEELGFKGLVPEKLDYNELKALKEKCIKDDNEKMQQQSENSILKSRLKKAFRQFKQLGSRKTAASNAK